MSKPCTAILIDPVSKTIREVAYNGHYTHIYDLIDCQTFDVARLGCGDGVYIDDEGMFAEERHFFQIDGYPQPLAGKGLVMGCDEDGNSITPSLSLKDVQGRVRFIVPVLINGEVVNLPA